MSVVGGGSLKYRLRLREMYNGGEMWVDMEHIRRGRASPSSKGRDRAPNEWMKVT